MKVRKWKKYDISFLLFFLYNNSNHIPIIFILTATYPLPDQPHRANTQQLANPQQPLTFLPGQWLDVHIPSIPNAGGFSITSTPADAQVLPSLESPAEAITTDETDVPPIDPRGRPPYVELAVQYAPSNPASAWLWRPADEILGTELSIRVGGSFVWPPSSNVDLTKVRNVVFVAGGVGIK